MGIATGFFIVNISRIARWTIYQVKKHGPTLSILAIVIIALVITAKIVPDLISMNNDDIQKINVEIDAGSVIRVGNEVLVRVMVTNEGVRHYANITTISFVDIKSKTIESDRIDVNLKPIGKEI